MALDADLVVDVLADEAVVTLGESLAPLNAFSINALSMATRVGRNTVQVEKSGTAPAGTANDNRTDYQAESGANTNIAITVNEISFQQTITAPEQIQGHQFLTAIPELSKALGAAVWDKITALVLTGTYGTGVAGTAGSITVANLQTLRTAVDSNDCNLLIERVESAAIMPDDKNSFELAERGAYGYNQIHVVSNFTGGTANTYAMACTPAAMVMVGGAPQRDPQVIESIRRNGVYEQFTIPGLNLSAELTIWTDLQTRAMWMGLATCFGVAAGDAAAGSLGVHA